MPKAKKVLSAHFQGKDFPIVEIDDRLDAYGAGQVVIRFVHQKDVHWSLHMDGPDIMQTISHPEYHSTWSEQRVMNARIARYKNPEKHGHYLKHEPLRKSVNQNGYALGSQRVYLKPGTGDAKYLKAATPIGVSDVESPMVDMVLSTSDNECRSEKVAVETSLGTIYFGLSM
jgi:hypothetical protein